MAAPVAGTFREWTSEQVEALMDLSDDGLTLAEIASHMERRFGGVFTVRSCEHKRASVRQSAGAQGLGGARDMAVARARNVGTCSDKPTDCATVMGRISRPSNASDLQRIVFVPDTHRPYHDRRAWALALKSWRAFQPDIIVILGDFADCFQISSHPKTPIRRDSFEQELGDVNEGLDDIESLGASRVLYCEGNHEERLDRYLTKNAPELYSMMTMRKLLRIDDRGWEWTSYRRHASIGALNLTHDEGNVGPYAAHRARATFGGNVVIGHTHRMGVTYEGNAKGTPHVGAMFGWLGDVRQVDYMHRVRAHAWQLGFGLGWMEPHGTVHVQAVPIVDYRCVIAGQLMDQAA